MAPEAQDRILNYFFEEAREQIAKIESGVIELPQTVQQPALLTDIFRAAHSVKGSSAMLGLTTVTQVAHHFETAFKLLREDPSIVSSDFQSLLIDSLVILKTAITQVQGTTNNAPVNRELTENPIILKLKDFLDYLKLQNNVDLIDGLETITQDPVIEEVFGEYVSRKLHQITDLCHQPDSSENRQKIQQILIKVGTLGEKFNFPQWEELFDRCQIALMNPHNSFHVLGNVLPKAIKQAQILVLSGRDQTISLTPELEAITQKPKSNYGAEIHGSIPLINLDSSDELAAFLNNKSTFSAADDRSNDEQTTNSFINLFDGELPNDATWVQDEEFISGDMALSGGDMNSKNNDVNNFYQSMFDPDQENNDFYINSHGDEIYEQNTIEYLEKEEIANVWNADLFNEGESKNDIAIDPDPTGLGIPQNSLDNLPMPNFTIDHPEDDFHGLNLHNNYTQDYSNDFTLDINQVDNTFNELTLDINQVDNTFNELTLDINQVPRLGNEVHANSIADDQDAENFGQENNLNLLDDLFELDSNYQSVPITDAESNPEFHVQELLNKIQTADSLLVGEFNGITPIPDDELLDINRFSPLDAIENNEATYDWNNSATLISESTEQELPSNDDLSQRSIEMQETLINSDDDSSVESNLINEEQKNDLSNYLNSSEKESNTGFLLENLEDLESFAGEDFAADDNPSTGFFLDTLDNINKENKTNDYLEESASTGFLLESLESLELYIDGESQQIEEKEAHNPAIADSLIIDHNLENLFNTSHYSEISNSQLINDNYGNLDLHDLLSHTVPLSIDNTHENSLNFDESFAVNQLDNSGTSNLENLDLQNLLAPKELNINIDDLDQFVMENQPQHIFSSSDNLAQFVASDQQLPAIPELDDLDQFVMENQPQHIFSTSNGLTQFVASDQQLPEIPELNDLDQFVMENQPQHIFSTSDDIPQFVASDQQLPAISELDYLENLAQVDSEPMFTNLPNINELDQFIANNEPSLASANFDDLDQLIVDNPPLTNFDNLANLLEEQPSSTNNNFDDLDSLFQDNTTQQPIEPTPANNFDDLSNLLNSPPPIAETTTVKPVNRKKQRTFEQTMRVSVKNLNNLNNLVGELVVNRNTLEQDHQRMRQFLEKLLLEVQKLNDAGKKMQDLYERSLLENSLLNSRQQSKNLTKAENQVISENLNSDIEYDPLEMDRFTPIHLLSQKMIELIVRVRESAADIEFVVDSSGEVTRSLRQITGQLQEDLTRTRMIPFAQTADRLQRGVRDNGLKYGKQVELYVEGRDTLIDKVILESLTDPLIHMINNAIAHGIEAPEIRENIGKSPVGLITVRALHQGNQTIISITDDGAGIDTERVKQKALQKGIISPEKAAIISKAEIYELLFLPSFSTKDQADELAGRGVGMDVVRTSLAEIRGTINTESKLGTGTTFTIRLPLALSIAKALLAVNQNMNIAFPMDGIEDSQDIQPAQIQTNEQGETCFFWRDTLMPFKPLSELLGYNRPLPRNTFYQGNIDEQDDTVSILVLRSGGEFLAVQVDRTIGEQEIVIKPLQGPAPKPVGIAGATVLGDGRIIPIVDVMELIDLAKGVITKQTSALWSLTQANYQPVKQEPMVLIIDDSITVRELLSMTFTRAGYRVEQARDGQEGWDKLRSGLPCDLVFCDIEMPRMDGLELLSRIQKDQALRKVPVAMLTSRGSDRHRQIASQLGASGYFIKPYLEEALLDAARRMIKGEVLAIV